METDKYLTAEEWKAIDRWIRKVKRKDYRPKKRGDTKAWKQLKLKKRAVACGYHRIIFDLRNGYVVKVAISKEGIQENEKEQNIFERTPPTLKRHLGRIAACGEGWLVMEKAKVKFPHTFSVIQNIRTLDKRFRKYGIQPRDILTRKRKWPKWQNIGINKRGDLIFIDYGSFRVDR